MLIQHIALVPEAAGIDPSELARVSAALQKQVTRDLSPAWGVYATVDAFPRLEDVPVGYWPILVGRDIGEESGVRLDRDGSPFAQIEHTLDWSLDASRACLEMLVNPFGKRTVSAPSPRSDQGRVEVVLEVCAPCADTLCAYAINDVVVSDFCLPAYYEEGPIAGGKRLSLNGTVTAPFRVLPGGHLTWFDVVSESYWRRSHWGENPVDSRLGKLSHSASTARELLPRSLPARLRASSPAHEAFQARIDLDRQHARRISEVRAMRLRASFLTSGSEAPVVVPERSPERLPERLPELAPVLEPEPEPVTAIDVTETEEPAPRASAVPPPLPRSSRPSAAAPTPVTILREPERTPGRSPFVLGAGALAVAAAIALMWRANEGPAASPPPAAEAPAAPATETTAQAATAPAPAPSTAPIPAAPAAADAPVMAAPPVPAAPSALPAPAPATQQAAPAEPVATTKPKRSKPRVEEAKGPPAPVEPEIADKPVLRVLKPAVPPQAVATAKVAPAPVGAPAEPESIDALIDTRR